MTNGAAHSQRVDQWLWFARIVKSRTLAQALVERGKVRLNRERLGKASAAVKPGDVLTVSTGPLVRVFQVVAIGQRRGPASEAVLLYKDSPVSAAASASGTRPAGAGRPTKRERRLTDRLKGRQDLP